jgi:MraZ protein
MFTGEFTHTVDAKGRVAIPVRFRMQLGEGAVLTKWTDGCAAIFTRSAFEQLATKVSALPLSEQQARDFARFVFRSTFDVETDAQGRIVLPPSIRDWAGLSLSAEAVVVGHFDRIEIWDPKRLEASQKGVASVAGLDSHMSGLGI